MKKVILMGLAISFSFSLMSFSSNNKFELNENHTIGNMQLSKSHVISEAEVATVSSYKFKWVAKAVKWAALAVVATVTGDKHHVEYDMALPVDYIVDINMKNLD